MNRQQLSILISALIVIFLAFSAYFSYTKAVKYDSIMLKQAQQNKIENKIDNYINKLFLSQENDTKIDNTTIKKELNFYVTLFFIGVVLLGLTYFISSIEIFLLSILTLAMMSWLVGVFAPIMSIEVFKELPIFGYTIFKYDTKSIFTTIQKLWSLQNYSIALLVALFSMIIPLLKTIALFITTITKTHIKYIDFIGKWSMADVFIISVLIANMSLSADEFTDAKVQAGIYFFAIYVLLSLLASYLVKRVIK